MWLRILVFESLLALSAIELSFVERLQNILVNLGGCRWLATGWAVFILQQPRGQTRATVEIITGGTLFGVNSYQ